MGRKKKQDNIPTSVWDAVNNTMPVLLSDYDLKGYMMQDEKTKVTEVQDFLRRQLQTSNIPKAEVPIFRMQMECMISWFGMGLSEVADEEFVELLSELSLNKSVGGHASILNLGNVGANVIMSPGKASEMRMGYDEQNEQQNEGLGQKIKRKVMG